LLLDPTFLQQFFHKSRARRQRTRFDPACPSQLLHELALGVTGKRHFLALSPSSTRRRIGFGAAGFGEEGAHVFAAAKA